MFESYGALSVPDIGLMPLSNSGQRLWRKIERLDSELVERARHNLEH